MEKHNWKKLAIGVGIGTAAGMLVLLTGSLILAWMITAEKIPYEAMNSWGGVLQAVCCMTACIIAMLRTKERRFVVSIITAVALLLLQLLISMLFTEGAFTTLAARSIINLCIGAAVGLLANKTKKRNGFPMKK